MPVGVRNVAGPAGVPTFFPAAPDVQGRSTTAQSLGSGALAGALISIAATPNAAAVGDLVIVAFCWASASVALTTVTDTSGNTWTVVSSPASASEAGGYGRTIVSTGWANGANTVTGTLASGSPGGRCWAAASIPAAYSPVFDQHAESQTTGGSVSIATASPLAQPFEEVLIVDIVKTPGGAPLWLWNQNFTDIVHINGSGTAASGVGIGSYTNISGATAITGGFAGLNTGDLHGTGIVAFKITLPVPAVTNQLTIALAQATSAAIQNMMGKPVALAETATIATAKQVGKPVSVAETATAAVTNRVAKTVTVSETATLTIAKLVAKPVALSQASALSVTAKLVHLLTIALTQASSVALVKQIGKPIALVQTSAVSVAKNVAKTVTATQTTAVSIAKRVGKPITVSQASAVSVTARLVHLLTIALTQVSAVAVVKRTAKTVPLAQASAVTVTRRIAKLVALVETAALSISAAAQSLVQAITGVFSSSPRSGVADSPVDGFYTDNPSGGTGSNPRGGGFDG